jgi:hypothetical protein
MNQYPFLGSSVHSTLNHEKNNRLYQHILESNYLNDHIYEAVDYNQDNVALIKFSNPHKFHHDVHSTQYK